MQNSQTTFWRQSLSALFCLADWLLQCCMFQFKAEMRKPDYAQDWIASPKPSGCSTLILFFPSSVKLIIKVEKKICWLITTVCILSNLSQLPFEFLHNACSYSVVPFNILFDLLPHLFFQNSFQRIYIFNQPYARRVCWAQTGGVLKDKHQHLAAVSSNPLESNLQIQQA